jgi:tryptophanyl-tRNA synthetase
MNEETTIPARKRVLSGMRPTGKLHLGNYMGALKNWVALQNETLPDGTPKYECFFFIADYHALTTDYADPSLLKQNIFEVALDFLSAGLDPGHCKIFIQSHVPQHAELSLLLGMITSVGWLERVPTYKDQQEQLREKDLSTFGFLGYPLLMSADILVYQADFVPVGQDQAVHVELTREVARRFNQFYFRKSGDDGDMARFILAATESDREKITLLTGRGRTLESILPEPQVLLTPSPKLPGTDGRKMSKSYGNSILLTDLPMEVRKKMYGMSNGGQRPTQYDPGDPDICPVGDMHRVFSDPHVLTHITSGCRTAAIRCDECKLMAANSINLHLLPIRKRREALEKNPDRVWEILEKGAVEAGRRAEQTMKEVRAVMGLSRDRSGVRVSSDPYNIEKTDFRDLATFNTWWNLEPPILARNLRDVWRKDIVPVETALKHDSEGLWLTRNNRRVFVTAAVQSTGDNAWLFSVKPKSYEILILLCWGKDFIVHDFVIPQKLYLVPWVTAKKRAGKDDIHFSVALVNGRYLLNLPDSTPIEITDTEAKYDIIGS